VSSKFALTILATLALGACQRPQPVHPALWQIDGPGGQKGWLLGTIHALPEPVEWRSPTIEGALAHSDRLVVEVARIEDAAPVFARLSRSPGLPPLRDRIDPALRPQLDRVMRERGLKPADLDPLETWAAALVLQQELASADGTKAENGIDRAIVSNYPRKVEEFEGAQAQLAIFDHLAEADQQVLLESVLRDAFAPDNASDAVTRGWARGDLAPIAAETERGFLGDPELRDALLVGRNRAWSQRLTALLQGGAHPFVAVGAAHMAGPQGLPAQLAARGYKVTRVQ